MGKNQYRTITGCYGATRGTTVAAIAEETVRQLTAGSMKAGNLEIVVEGVGCPDPKLMPDSKVNHPVRPEWAEAVNYWLNEMKIPGAEKIKNVLDNKGRQRVTKEQLEKADTVYLAESYLIGMYAACEGKGTRKYQTMIQGSDLRHERFGIDMDDIEASTDFVQRRILPLKFKDKGMEPIGDPDPRNAKYYDLSGKEYVAGSKEALMVHSKDVVEIGLRLGYRTYLDACAKAGIRPKINYNKETI